MQGKSAREKGKFKHFGLITMVVVGLLFWVGIAAGQIPRLISHQGKLIDNDGVALDGDIRMSFEIYDDSTAGNLLWSEAYTRIHRVTVHNGMYSVLLGSSNPFPHSLDFSEQYWLAIEANGVLFPKRIQLVTSPYAFRAIYADTVDYAAFADSADQAAHAYVADSADEAAHAYAADSAAYADSAGAVVGSEANGKVDSASL